MRLSFMRALPIALAVLAMVPGLSSAQSPPPAVPATTPHAAARPQLFLPGLMGMIVALDPESGMLGLPTPEQAAALSRSAVLTRSEEEMLSRSTEGLRETRLADGTVLLDLQGRFQEFSVARIGADGKITFECLSDVASVRQALRGTLAPAPQPAVLEDR